jgi:hypothetical protein
METNDRLFRVSEALRMINDSKTDNPYIGTMAGPVWRLAHDSCISCVEACATAIEVKEVVYAKWLHGYPICCSACGGPAPTEYEDCNRYEAWLTSYCPHCGATMTQEESNNE